MINIFHHTNHLTVLSMILLVVGLTLRYIIGKRRFNRRGVAGLRYFKSYSVALFTVIIERIINIIAMVTILGAVFLYLIK